MSITDETLDEWEKEAEELYSIHASLEGTIDPQIFERIKRLIQTLRAERTYRRELEGALKEVREAFIKANDKDGIITDTVWLADDSPCTLVDCIDLALAKEAEIRGEE